MCDGVVGKTPDRASPKLPEKKPPRKRGPTRRSRYKFQKNDKRTKTVNKKKRVVPERESRELRKELAARLLSKVDKHLRGKYPRKYYLSDGRTLDEGKLELTAAPIIQATLGKSSNPEMARKCFEMCKSIVKQRRAYVKRKPGTPIKQVVVVSGSDDESSGGDIGGGGGGRADCESSSEEDVQKLFEDSEKEDDKSQTKEDEDDKSQTKEDEDDESQKDEEGDSDTAENSDDSDYHNRKVEKEAPSRATKMRCQAKDCNRLLPINECFPKVCNVVKINRCY